jgi:two-component sensor histidine kinase
MIVRPLDLSTLLRMAESCGALVVADETDGPEVILDSDAFERFTDQVFQHGTDFGLQLAQAVVDELGGSKNASPPL